jgi:Phage stabilisation protein
MQTPILGSSYVARSINAADNRMVNLFPEVTPDGGKTNGFLNRAPGLKFQQTIGTGPIRGLWAHQTNGQDFYVASGTEFYKVNALTGTPTKLGDISGTGQVSIADNGTQLFIACNPNSYIYNEVTNTFQQITDPDFPGAVTVGYLDGYFVFNEPDSQRMWVTALLNGLDVSPLDFASAEGSPDGIVAINVDHREVWVFGTDSVEVWYDAGLQDFPLQRIQGAFNEIGCVAAFSVAKLDNGLFWLGCDARGQGIVYRANGYTGTRVSTHAIEYAIQSYGNISDAIAYTYQQDGHAFYVLTFPSANATWVYDVATQAWHERAGWSNGSFIRHRSNCQCNFQGYTIVGDYENGNIYTLDLDVYADNGGVQKWLRSWRALPTNQNNLKRTSQHSLQLDCESGTGLNNGQGADPQVMLRWSDDGGHTWSNEHWASMGKIGQYFRRVIWRRLGMTDKLRDRVYEVSGTDPVKVAIMGAQLDVTPTNA